MAMPQDQVPIYNKTIASCISLQGKFQNQMVFESCIQSTQFLMLQAQQEATGKRGTRGTKIYTLFGDRRKFEINDNFINDTSWRNINGELHNLTNYPFGSNLPLVGQGLCALLKNPDNHTNETYEMHFSCVIAIASRGALITTIYDIGNENNMVVLDDNRTQLIETVDEFLVVLPNPDLYAIGLVTLDPSLYGGW